MKIHVNLSRDELLNALAAIENHIIPRGKVQVPTFEAVLLWIPIGIVIAYVFEVYGGNAALVMLGTVVLLVFGTNFLATRGRKRLHNYIVENLSARDVEYEFLDTHINLRAPNHSGRTEWALIKDVVETDEFVLLFIDNSQAYVIPKRIPESAAISDLARSKSQGRVG